MCGCLMAVVAGPVVTVEKPERSLRRFSKQLWKSSKETAEGILC